jgi:hypothetical protein
MENEGEPYISMFEDLDESSVRDGMSLAAGTL